MLALDLGVFHRQAHRVSVEEAAGWSIFWIVLALIFNVVVYFWMGSQAATEYLTGYLIEKSLSVDNLFVFALIFSYFRVPHTYQHRVLFWGVLGALVMRGTLILVGTSLIARFHWIFYVFGALLLASGYRMLRHDQEQDEFDPEKNIVVRMVRKIIPVTGDYDGQRLFTRKNGLLKATPLFIVLLVVESTDLVFAVDSIPAIFAITQDPFIVYTSNVFSHFGAALALLLALARPRPVPLPWDGACDHPDVHRCEDADHGLRPYPGDGVLGGGLGRRLGVHRPLTVGERP